MKTISNFTKTLGLFLLLISASAFSQSEDLSDFESWNILSFQYELNKKWEFGVEGQLRLKEDASEIDKYFGELSSEYTVSKGFKLAAGLRYIRENDNVGAVQGYENHFRYHFDASYKHKVNDLSLKYRLRYQNKNELGVDDNTNQHFRLKAGATYNIKNWKLDPKFAAEIFHHNEKGEENGFDKYRLTFGSEYKFKNAGSLDFYYRFKKEINETNPESTHILGLKYSFKLKNKRN